MEDNRALNDIARWEKRKGDDSTWFSHYQECSDYFWPEMNNVTQQPQEGNKRNTKLYDETGIFACREFAAGMYGNMSPANSRWFVVKAKNSKDNEKESVQDACLEITKKIEEELAASNFELQMNELLLGLGTFGMSCMSSESDTDSALNFVTHHISQTWHFENSKRQIDTTFRLFEFTARQAYQAFTEKELAKCDKIVEAYKDPKMMDKKFEFLHVCEPRREGKDGISTKIEIHPYRSAYIAVQDKIIIRETGIRRNKYLTPRYMKSSSEIRGRGPGMMCLRAQKLLNCAVRDTSIGIEKKVSPPTLAPNDGSYKPLSTSPRSVIYCEGTKDLWPQEMECKADIMAAQWFIERLENKIKKGFHNDLFRTLDEVNGTRPEVEILQRIEEGIKLLGPVAGRLQSELYSPLIIDCAEILVETGKIVLEELPEELIDEKGGLNLGIEYVSRLALAMRIREINATRDTMNALAGILSLNQESADVFDFDAIARGVAYRFGMPVDFLRKTLEVQEIRKGRQEAAAQQQAMQMMSVGSQAISNLSKPIDNGSALNSMKQEYGL